MIDVVGIGSTAVDYFFKADQKFFKKHHLKPEDDLFFKDLNLSFTELEKELPLITKSPGGMSLNTLLTLARLGLKTSYYGIIGKDKEADFWLQNISPIKTSDIIRDGSTHKCACLISHNGRYRTFISELNPREDQFFKELDPRRINRAKFLHITPFYTDEKKSFNEVSKLIRKISDPRISFTPGVFYSQLGLKKIASVLKRGEILFINQNELRILTHKDPKKGSITLLKYGPRVVVCTLGVDGVLVTTAEEQFHQAAHPVRKVIDSTGAGDAFAGGFLYGVAKEKPLRWTAHFAVRIAAESLANFGSVAAPV